MFQILDPLLLEGVVVLEAGHLVAGVEFLQPLDEGVHVPLVAPVRLPAVLQRLGVQDLCVQNPPGFWSDRGLYSEGVIGVGAQLLLHQRLPFPIPAAGVSNADSPAKAAW